MILSVVIPAYNEAQNIKQTIIELKQLLTLSDCADDHEIVVVDDHSSDNTYEVVESFKEEKIKCVRLSRRSGSHTAIRAGFAASKGNAVLCIAADGQEDTAVIAQMVEKWNEGAKIVWALRRQRNTEPWYIRKPAQLFYRFLAWLGDTEQVEIDFSRADFFLLDKHVVDAINACAERNTSLFGLIHSGFRRVRQGPTQVWKIQMEFCKPSAPCQRLDRSFFRCTVEANVNRWFHHCHYGISVWDIRGDLCSYGADSPFRLVIYYSCCFCFGRRSDDNAWHSGRVPLAKPG